MKIDGFVKPKKIILQNIYTKKEWIEEIEPEDIIITHDVHQKPIDKDKVNV